jgi:hypothetical protein
VVATARTKTPNSIVEREKHTHNVGINCKLILKIPCGAEHARATSQIAKQQILVCENFLENFSSLSLIFASKMKHQSATRAYFYNNKCIPELLKIFHK